MCVHRAYVWYCYGLQQQPQRDLKQTEKKMATTKCASFVRCILFAIFIYLFCSLCHIICLEKTSVFANIRQYMFLYLIPFLDIIFLFYFSLLFLQFHFISCFWYFFRRFFLSFSTFLVCCHIYSIHDSECHIQNESQPSLFRLCANYYFFSFEWPHQRLFDLRFSSALHGSMLHLYGGWHVCMYA